LRFSEENVMEASSPTIAAATREPKVLTRAQVEAFARNGYHFPLRALSAEEAKAYRAKLEGAEAHLGTSMKTGYRNKPHLVFTRADELIRHPRILDAVEDILGPNLLVWSSSLFMKDAHDPSYISWHQDSTYWGLSHPDVVTAWLALSVSHMANGCMRVDPGSHLLNMPHRTPSRGNLLTRGQEVQVEVDERV
jgi:ectoine hydroxylase-related dioxygenase (phytanoyl-CoA dioxygenase family)